MKREWRLNVPCTEPGCTEVARYAYETRRDFEGSFERRNAPTYKCVLHSNAARVLSMSKLRTEWISQPSRQETYGRFWGNAGLLIDTAYYARAEDFPVGTRIRVTAEVLPPESEEAKP